ncbi:MULTISPECIES: hypothetical protein [Streptomyces]|uniref:Secreted protein n=1 Tax=Streptomyces solicathayae TaxID=3081768 RepID=A0ABZ0LMY4_9ACTN|nr:hypothetical protein [Streptomyces sp. HUAS YS2]WOX20233.1 hypothetical protein R2D22_02030 [Streptomyces sp. HUAS YS2]
MGLLVIVSGAVLMAVGVIWKGRIVRPLSRARARAVDARLYHRHLVRSADLAIASARDAAGHGEPAIVTVADVLRVLDERFGYVEVPRWQAGNVLRRRFERAGCAADCVTDAYHQDARR